MQSDTIGHILNTFRSSKNLVFFNKYFYLNLKEYKVKTFFFIKIVITRIIEKKIH